MNTDDFDFEGTGGTGGNQGGANGNQGGQGDGEQTHLNGGDADDVNGNGDNGDGDGDGNGDQGNQGGEGGNGDDNSSTGELNAGDQVEFDGQTYTVAENGDLLDAEGKVFKEAKDVKSWIDSMDADEPDALSLAAIQEAIGMDITDEAGNAVEFTNDAAGVKAYVDAVINTKSNDIQNGAINKLFADNPLLKQFSDYVQLTGSPRGFGEIPDRSGIVLDKENESQLVAVIKMAANEFNNKSLNDNYIKYLRDSGGLYDEASNMLKALVEKDKAVRDDIAARAEAERKAQAEETAQYWNKLDTVIKGRLIAGYKLPESIVKEVNGQKVTLTPADFYSYLSKATEQDADGNRVSRYQKDLAELSDDDYLNRELLQAWLMFTGGSYKDLVDMAVKEEQVRKLRIKAKENRTTRTIKVNKKSGGKADLNDIVL